MGGIKKFFQRSFYFLFLIADQSQSNNLNVAGISAQMAYYILLAFIPMLIMILNLIGQIPNLSADFVYTVLQEMLPQVSYDFIISNIEGIMSSSSSTTIYFFVISFYFASMGSRAFIIGINRAYHLKENRSIVVIYLLSFLFTLLFLLAVLISMTFLVFGGRLLSLLFNFIHFTSFHQQLINIFMYSFSIIMFLIIFSLLYKFSPNDYLPYIATVPGAFFSTTMTLILSNIFGILVNNSSKYTILFGNLGGMFALLVWLYLICFIIVIGGEINALLYYEQDYLFAGSNTFMKLKTNYNKHISKITFLFKKNK
jgi:membrane protein